MDYIFMDMDQWERDGMEVAFSTPFTYNYIPVIMGCVDQDFVSLGISL